MAINKPEDAHRLFANAFNSEDIESIIALYESEATLVPQPGQVVKGISVIREALQGFLALKGRISVETQYIIQAKDTALMRGKWHLVGTGPDGKSIEMNVTAQKSSGASPMEVGFSSLIIRLAPIKRIKGLSGGRDNGKKC